MYEHLFIFSLTFKNLFNEPFDSTLIIYYVSLRSMDGVTPSLYLHYLSTASDICYWVGKWKITSEIDDVIFLLILGNYLLNFIYALYNDPPLPFAHPLSSPNFKKLHGWKWRGRGGHWITAFSLEWQELALPGNHEEGLLPRKKKNYSAFCHGRSRKSRAWLRKCPEHWACGQPCEKSETPLLGKYL